MGVGTRDIHQGTMSSDPNVEAMQQRMLHLENALSRVIHHLEMTAARLTQLSRSHRGDVRCGEPSSRMKEDWDTDIITFMQHEHFHLKQLIQQFERELELSQNTSNRWVHQASC